MGNNFENNREQKEEPKFNFGGVDCYGIEASEIKLPDDMPKEGELVSTDYIDNKLIPFIEDQVKNNKYYKVKRVKYSVGNKILLIVDVSDDEFEKYFENVEKSEKPADLSENNKKLFYEWEKEVERAWQLEIDDPNNYEENYKEVNRVEGKIRRTLEENPNLVNNIKEVIKTVGDNLDLALFLCHWTPKDDADLVKLLDRFILNPDSENRNNASRSILYNYTHTLDQIDIHKFLKQMQLPFHTDRNKALYVLEAYSKDPKYKEELLQFKDYFIKLSKAKMPNIVQPVEVILKNINS